ncbi:hypothetical protein EDD36DRAFT_492935 [Exophiala viscosa]|uniref:Uracil catabolism protein 4 n=1 Tax=Exophiala viscosa TaxID=2486360 RepID=A0AAN6E3J0_9EURO|nr:hypothetical protein EDD36DRAFT_492935 [Exophiala viscosa]
MGTTTESSVIDTLLSLPAIRHRAGIVYEAAKQGTLNNFDFHPEALPKAADLVASIISRDFGPERFSHIPPHGRWQHFEVGAIPRVSHLLHEWKTEGVDDFECTRRLIDLFFVSVLLDAGAGDSWLYTEPETGLKFGRSEGLAVASLYLYQNGRFGSSADGAVTVNGRGLQGLTEAVLSQGMQVSSENPLTGLEPRAKLLQAFGASLLVHPQYFGDEGRPGNLVDYLTSRQSGQKALQVVDLWNILQSLLIPIWPKDRTRVFGEPVGDAWPLKCLGDSVEMKSTDDRVANIQPFHKLTQWLAFSLMVPFERVLGYTWQGSNLLTGLPEYRNGGLFVDTGVLTLKPEVLKRGQKVSGTALPMFEVADDAIVEWRALTVALLDEMHGLVSQRLPLSLSMAQVLEAGTWKAGRELAAQHRPETRSSPILVKSDGTVF